MSLYQCVQVCVLFAACQSTDECHGSKLSSGDIVKNAGGNIKEFLMKERKEEYEVQSCLGKGNSGEVWTMHGSEHLLKFHPSAHQPEKIASECLFGKIAAQKDSAHFANCFDHGSGEVWTLEGSDLVLKYKWKGGYSVWQRMGGQKVSALTPSSITWSSRRYLVIEKAKVENFEKVFPDLNSVLGHLNQLFHIFDALQKPGTIAPGIGVRQWNWDAHPHNILASAGRLALIDYGMHTQCCNDPQKCAVDSGFEDVQIQPCRGTPRSPDLQAGSICMVEFMLEVAFRPTFRFQSDWFQQLHNASLESLVMELRSSSGPSHEMFRNQWCLESAKVILGMASTLHKKDDQWPPVFMEQVKLALHTFRFHTPIVQEVLNVEM